MFVHAKESHLRKQESSDHRDLYKYIESVDVSDIILVRQVVLLIVLLTLPYRSEGRKSFYFEECLCFIFLTLIDLFLLHVQVQLNLDIFQQMFLHHPSIKRRKIKDKPMCSKPF